MGHSVEGFMYSWLLGAFGALAVEVLKAYELRGKLHLKKYRAMLRMPLFWLTTIGFIAVSGVLSWAINDATSSAPMHLIITGAGAAAIIRKATEAGAANTKITGGSSEFRAADLFI